MLGFDLRVHQGGRVVKPTDAHGCMEVVDSTVVLSRGASYGLIDTYGKIRGAAVKAHSLSGYPSLFEIHARDVPFQLENVPDDEIVIVEMWDQS